MGTNKVRENQGYLLGNIWDTVSTQQKSAFLHTNAEILSDKVFIQSISKFTDEVRPATFTHTHRPKSLSHFYL